MIKSRSSVFLAPMAGVTDKAFRQIAIEYGAGLTYTEMVSAKGLDYGNRRTAQLINPADNEDFFGVQLFASEPEPLRSSIEALQNSYPAISVFDINMGCPAPKITKNGEGSALMKEPEKAAALISAAANVSRVPVTVKFRKGWDERSINAVEFAKMAQDCGAAAVTVHGRTRDQFYSGHSDNAIIAAVKQAVSIPVIGNGDIFCAQDALDMFEETGCDAVMVARGAQGNPFIFREILHLLETGLQAAPPTNEEKALTLLRQAKLTIDEKGEYLAMRQLRKHAAWYLKGVKNASRARDAAVKMRNIEDLKQLLSVVYDDIDIDDFID